MLLSDILRAKGATVFTIRSDARLSDVVREMVAHNVGSLLVGEGDTIAGIITERDILRAIAEIGIRVEEAPVQDWMTTHVICGSPHDDIDTIMGLMTEKRIRHLPVMDRGKLAGIVSIGDVVKAEHVRLAMENQQLRKYIHG